MASSEIDPLTGKRRKTGGRAAGVPNRSTSARHAAMAKVNEALAAIGEDEVSGFRLLREVIKHRDTPLDVKIQCAGLLRGQETQEQRQPHVVFMPPQIPAADQHERMAIWMLLYNEGPASGDPDPEWDAAVATILRLIPTRKLPERTLPR